jgi:hypothetical protein
MFFLGKIEFIRDSNTAITICKASNIRVRNLCLKKVKQQTDILIMYAIL